MSPLPATPRCPEWREDGIPDRDRAGERGIPLRVAALTDVPVLPDQEALDRLIAGTQASECRRPTTPRRAIS